MKNKFQSFEDGMRMAGGSIQHPLSIHSASIGTCRRHRVWQVLMTLVFLFTLSIGQMWADQTDLISGVTLPDVPASSLNMASQTTFTPDANGWIVMQPNADIRNNDYTWFTAMAWNTSSQTISDVSSFTAPFYTLNSVAVTTVQQTARTKAIRFTGATDISFLVSSGGSRTIYVSLYSYSGTTQSLVETKSGGNSWNEFLFSSLTPSTDYVAYMYESTNSNGYVAEIAIKKYTASGPVDPTASFVDGAYTLDGADLDLSSLFTTNSDGAVTYTITNAGTTSAALRADGKSFYASAAGSATVKVEQAATASYNAFNATATITVSAPAATHSVTAATEDAGKGTAAAAETTVAEGATTTITASPKTGYVFDHWVVSGAGATLDDASANPVTLTMGTADATVTAYFAEKVCPTSGVVYTMTMKSKSLSGVTQNTEVALAGDYATEEGGVSYIGNKSSDAGKAQIKTDGGGTVYFNGNDAYVKIVLDCPLKADDKITFVPGSGTRQVCFTTTNTRTDTYQTSSNTFTVSSAFLATAADPENVTTLYVWRIGSSTYLHSLTITRPYNITFESEYGDAPSAMTGFEVTLTEITGVPGWEHTGWTANKDVKVGDDTKTAGTALDVDATVKVSADTKFTATWVPFSVKHTVTYYNGEAIPANKLGEEEISEGSNPTGAGLAPTKRGYTFGGWSLTDGGAAVALSSITVNEDKNLFVVWTPVPCPANGTVFAFEMNNDAKPGTEVKAPANGTLVIDEYLTESGFGSAIIGNTASNQYASVKTTPNITLSGQTGYLKLALECALQAGDVITIAKNNTQIHISDEAGASGPTGNKYTTASNTENEIVVGANATTAAWAGAMDLYFWYKGGGVNITAVSVVRPYTVSFNLNGQTATAIPDQKIIAGGKVTEPTDPVVEGQAFGGWFTDNACTAGNEWDFANDVVNDDVELFAKWTALPKLILNRGAATTGDDVVSYPTVGDPVAVPACPFTYSGYIFAGWVYSPAVTVEDGSFNMPNEDLTLTAQWVDASSVARIGSNYYATLADALDHAADGEIVLLQDINVEAQVEIADGVSATIDLAGHKIEYTGTADLTSGVIMVHNGGSLTINDSSDPDAGSVVAGEKAYAALALTKAGDDASKPATLTINGGIFTGTYYAITGHGSRHNTVTTINGGTFSATATNDNLGIYHPQNGTLTINGGTITGYASAIEMRAGTLVINDGTFTATATEFICNPNGGGTTTQGAAIAIAQHTTKKDISVTINGGTFNGVKALNESNPQSNDPAPQVTMAISNGTFNGEVTTADVNHFVSGGTFSTPVAESQCAAGYVPETKPNGKYGVIYPAQSIDFEAIIDTYGTDATAIAELDAQLAAKHYDIDGTLNDDRLDNPDGKPYDKGFKVKKTGLTISFSVEAGKVVEITTGSMSGASIKVDAEDAVAMTASHTHTYYSANAQAFLITMTAASNKYNIFKSIVIRDPYQVSFDVNGGEGSIAPRLATPSVVLPDAANGTQNFAGWYTDADVFVGMNGDSYTPTEDITLVAHWEALSTINTLSDLKVDGTTVDGFDADVHTYYFVLPYGTDVSNLPKITAATPTNANATVSIFPTDGPVWTEDFGGCYRQQANVTPQDPNAAIGYNDIRITIAPKDPLCIIKAEHDGTATGATVTGYYGGTKDKKTANNGKLGVKDNYMGIKLAEEAGTFKAGDVLKIYAPTPSAKVRIYSDKGTTRINAEDGTFDSEKMFTYTLTEDEEWIYLYRRTDDESDMNPTLGYMAVYRPVPSPLVETITFNGAAGVVDNTASPKTITVEVPASTDIATMPVVATFYSNDPSQTSGAVTGGTWAEGVNEYIVTDKDNDQTVYTVTITKAAPSSDATLSALSYGTPATAIALADGVYAYEVVLPYGTSDVPALAATAHHAGATIESIDDATAFVNRHATSTVTVKAEDNATTQVYTVNFTVDRYESKVLWDGSTMTQWSDITAAAAAAGVSVVKVGDDITVESKNSSFAGKNYTKCIQYGGNTRNDRYFGIEIPAGKVAKVSVVYRSRGNSARSIIIGTAIASAIDESAIVYATKENDTELLYKLTADIFAAGTIYINTTNGFQVFEIDVQLADGHGRSAMLGAGVYGTVCVPNNVAVEDIQGITVYELMGREPEYGKLAFDEIVSGELEAGVPYVFQASRNHMALLYGEESVAEPVDKGNGMYGTFTDITLYELTDIYYFAQRALWGCADLTSLSVPANRAYVKLSEIDYLQPNSAPAPGRRRITMAVNGKQVVTGIDNLNAGDQPVKVMIDGQMYILRGEKMYDATGRLVK